MRMSLPHLFRDVRPMPRKRGKREPLIEGGCPVEVAGTLMSIAVLLAPSVKDWVDSVTYRNRAQGRAALVRARRGEESEQHGEGPGKRQGRGRG